MIPNRNANAGLVDLLDRILDKGLVLNADVIISISGIPLLGLNLKATLAGMDTMIKYGIWEDWDVAQRACAAEEQMRKGIDKPPLLNGEEIRLKIFGSQWYSEGIYQSWRPGHLYVTSRRLFLYRKEPAEILFETYYENIEGLAMERKENIAKKETDYLYISLKSGAIATLHPTDASVVIDTIVEEMNRLGLSCGKMKPPAMDKNADKFLKEGENLVHCEKMWYHMELPAPGSVKTWKPGRMYLTSERVCWWHDFDERIAFEASLREAISIGIEVRDFGGMLGMKRVLIIAHKSGEVCFSGDDEAMQKMEEMLCSNMAKDEEMETCPSCGAEAPVQELLTIGCMSCGWVSPKVKKMKMVV
ncbi:MAG: gas vesicle protein [Methanothrix sp.]|jgi:hypothetical protein|nr:gas vesicle protein [Methanothrix sp.]